MTALDIRLIRLTIHKINFKKYYYCGVLGKFIQTATKKYQKKYIKKGFSYNVLFIVT